MPALDDASGLILNCECHSVPDLHRTASCNTGPEAAGPLGRVVPQRLNGKAPAPADCLNDLRSLTQWIEQIYPWILITSSM